jgi:hypothetical protein
VAVVSDKQLIRSVLAIMGTVQHLADDRCGGGPGAAFGIINTMLTAIRAQTGDRYPPGTGGQAPDDFFLFLYESGSTACLGASWAWFAGFAFRSLPPLHQQSEFTAF